ncbi:hypothetical protein PGIGA_G00193420 [Pangasianodon gigas]|uniref:Uncharacterized protein n=1 Tax=Pangasianodon gigas TaxID=30993 RepID=A0ACC5WCQ5_PANGG|nr:hypothetical protein [Pangasianodon gigas]
MGLTCHAREVFYKFCILVKEVNKKGCLCIVHFHSHGSSQKDIYGFFLVHVVLCVFLSLWGSFPEITQTAQTVSSFLSKFLGFVFSFLPQQQSLNLKQTVKANLHETSIKFVFISALCHVMCPLDYLLSFSFLFVSVKREPGQVNKDKHDDLKTCGI